MSAWRTDRGGIVIGWLIRLTLVLGLFGMLAYDGIALGVGRMGLTDDGDAIARAAQTSWQQSKSSRSALAAASAEATSQGVQLDAATFRIAKDGSVAFTVSDTVNTVLFAHLPKAHEWTTITVDVTRPAPVS